MELIEKKKRAAAIAVLLYLQAEANESGKACCNWSKMGMNRTMNDKEFLFRQGKTIGVRIF